MKGKVLVIYGGLSKERDISLKSGKAIAEALKRRNFQVKEFDFQGKIEQVIEEFKPDVAFIALHGTFGEDGSIQGALEILGVPYTGSSVLQSAISMNKLFSKYLFREFNIPTASFLYTEDLNTSYEYAKSVIHSEKMVIKPVDQGSAIGISIIQNEEQFKEGLQTAFSFSHGVIIEEFIQGKEITVSIIGNSNNVVVLPIIEIIPAHNFYDYFSKYTPGMSTHIIPANIPKEVSDLASKLAYKVYTSFSLRDFARIDFVVKDAVPYVLEVNTIPGMTETSLIPDAARAYGMSFDDLTEFIVEEAFKRRK
jgi:D-alanine-D-alanine ligase